MAQPAEDRREDQGAEKSANQERILEVGRQPALLRELADPRVESRSRGAPARDGSSASTRSSASVSARRPLGDDRSIEHRDPIGDTAHLIEIVRHHQHGRPAVLQRAKQLLELAHPAFVEAGWPARRGCSSSGIGSSACASSTRRSSPPDSTDSGRRSRPAQPDVAQQRPRCAAGVAALDAEADRPPLARQRQKILDRHRQARIDGEALRHIADAAVACASCATMRPSNGDLAEQRAEQRGLPGAVRTDDHVDAAAAGPRATRRRAAARGCGGARPR